MFRLCILIALIAMPSLTAFGQVRDANFTGPNELLITIKKGPPTDPSKLRVVVYKTTGGGNVEVQNPEPLGPSNVTSADSNETSIRVRTIETHDPSISYSVIVSGYVSESPGGAGTTFIFDPYTIEPAITSELFFNPLACGSGIQLVVKLPAAAENERAAVVKWIRSSQSQPREIGTLETAQGNSAWEQRPITSIRDPKMSSGEVRTCFDVADRIYGTYAVRVKFKSPPPSVGALSKEHKVQKFGEADTRPPAFGSSDAFVRKGDPGERSRISDIEAGITFIGSKDEATGKRTGRGVLDLQIAPIRARPFLSKAGDTAIHRDALEIPQWFGYWTPIFLDANVSTGPITKDTVSLNRIAIGGEFEFRFVPVEYATENGVRKPVLERFATYHRFALNYTHYSDRDFKQNEITAGGEYGPIFGKLNRPRKMNFGFVERPSDGKWVRRSGLYGYSVVPAVGFEFGRTYSRRNPFEAIEPSPNIKRIYAKLDASYEYGMFGFRLTDQLYYRGESETKKVRNYFNADFEVLMNDIADRFRHAVFFNYQLGSKPPFTSNVDAFTVGYRIRFSH